MFGAIYLDGGLDSARDVIGRLFQARLAQLPTAQDLKDPKTRLQEALQSRGLALPRYTMEEVSGEPHEQWFVASCVVASLEVSERGEGPSRRKAEQEAAQRVLAALEQGQA